MHYLIEIGSIIMPKREEEEKNRKIIIMKYVCKNNKTHNEAPRTRQKQTQLLIHQKIKRGKE